MGKLAGKAAIVTGASKGIGADIARGLAVEGASVVVNYSSSREGADKVVAEITSKGGKAIAVQGNVSSEADVKRLFAETKNALGRLDILVNNAGVYQFSPIDEFTEDHFHHQFNTNVLGLLLTTREAVKHFTDGGSIINIGSSVTSTNPPTGAIYTATKSAVDSITRVLSKELGPRRIRVNSINPALSRPKARTPSDSSAANGRRTARPPRHWAAPASPATSPPSPFSSPPPTLAGSPARSSSPRAVSAN